MKLDSAAHTVLGLTYLGAPLCLFANSIAVDSSGAPWIAGTFSPAGGSPQTASPFQIGIGSGFISKFSPDLTQLLFSTYFNSVSSMALDSTGLAYVVGAGSANNVSGNQQAYVAKIDPAPTAVSLESVTSAVPSVLVSNYQGIAPGELLRILGKNMGPAATTAGIVTGGVLASAVAGVQVTFDGVAVPLLSVSAGEIDLVAPFELATQSSTTVQVQYNGVKSNAVQILVSPTALQVLGVYDGDFTPNSAANPAKAGSVMTLYVSGLGQTNPASQDGQVNSTPPSALVTAVQIEWIGVNPTDTIVLPVTFAGTAPGLAAGIFQINFVAPVQSLLNLDVVVGNASGRFNVAVQ